MSWRRPATPRSVPSPGIILLILSLVHAPLPEPDFHNIRHHDRPGEVCEHHDHLLRWHPGAGVASDVAVLHWHWYLPAPPGADSASPGSGQAVHAHVPAWAAVWDSGPQVAPDTASRLAPRPSPSPLDAPLALPALFVVAVPPDPGARTASAFGATFAPRVSLTSLLHRWTC